MFVNKLRFRRWMRRFATSNIKSYSEIQSWIGCISNWKLSSASFEDQNDKKRHIRWMPKRMAIWVGNGSLSAIWLQCQMHYYLVAGKETLVSSEDENEKRNFVSEFNGLFKSSSFAYTISWSRKFVKLQSKLLEACQGAYIPGCLYARVHLLIAHQ